MDDAMTTTTARHPFLVAIDPSNWIQRYGLKHYLVCMMIEAAIYPVFYPVALAFDFLDWLNEVRLGQHRPAIGWAIAILSWTVYMGGVTREISGLAAAYLLILPVLVGIALAIMRQGWRFIHPELVLYFAAIVLGTMTLDDLGLVRLAGYIGAIAVYAIARRYAYRGLVTGLYYAGMLYPFLLMISAALGHHIIANTASLWPVAFLLTALQRRGSLPAHKVDYWWYYLMQGITIVVLNSRGGYLNLAVALTVWLLWERRRQSWRALIVATVGLAGLLAVLMAWQWHNTLDRFDYWIDAMLTGLSSPVWGVGLWTYANRHGHAHNILFQTWAEGGILGILSLSLLVGRYFYNGPSRWRTAVLAGLMAHCMVDFPLFFSGPLFLVAALLAF